MSQRKIIHIDMDAFFASVEQHDDPSLCGLPLAVGFDGPRGVVSTASYEARQYGVHSAMPIATAKRRCPQLRIVTPRFDRYKEISGRVHRIFLDYTDLVEPLSIDEAFLDVTENRHGVAGDGCGARDQAAHRRGDGADGIGWCELQQVSGQGCLRLSQARWTLRDPSS